MTDEPRPKRRLRSCLEHWPEAVPGAYHPKCCRYDLQYVTDEDLEPRSADRE